MRTLAILALAGTCLAETAQEVPLAPKGVGPNLVHPAQVVVDEDAHLAYLLGLESAALGVLDLRTLALRNVPLPAAGKSVWTGGKAGTVYVVHGKGVWVSARRAEAWKDAPVAEPWLSEPDEAADGVYVAAAENFVRVGPDASVTVLFKPLGKPGYRQFAVDPRRGLVHVAENGSTPPVVHTHKLADGAIVASRTLTAAPGGFTLSRIHVEPAAGRVVVLFADHSAKGPSQLLIAPAEKGDFRAVTVPGALDTQHALLHAPSKLLFLANDNSADVTIVDLSADPPGMKNVPAGGKPNGLAYDAKHGRLFVQTWSSKVAMVDVPKRAAAGTFDAFSCGHLYKGVAVDPALGRALAVTGNQGFCGVTVFDLKDGKTRFVKTGTAPMDAVWAGGKLVVATNDDRVVLVDPAGKAPADVACPVQLARALDSDPASGDVVVACGEWVLPNQLCWLDTAKWKFTAGPATPRGPFAVRVGGGSAWTLSWADEQLSETDLEKKTLRKVAVPGTRAWSPRHLLAGKKGAYLLRAQPGVFVSVPRGGEMDGFELPADPASFALDDRETRAFVAGGEGETAGVWIVDLATKKVDTVPLGKAPVDVAFDPASGAAVVADLADLAVFRVDGAKATRAAIPDGAAPDAVAVDPAHGIAFVAARTADRLLLYRVTIKDLAFEKILDAACPYGAEVTSKAWVRSTNSWIPRSRFALDAKLAKGALVDYPGGRVFLFNLR